MKLLAAISTALQVISLLVYYGLIPTCLLAGLFHVIEGSRSGSWAAIVGGFLLLWIGCAGAKSVIAAGKSGATANRLASLLALAQLGKEKSN